MDIKPIILESNFVRLEPLTLEHEEALNQAAADGELWKSPVTIVPTRDTMRRYISTALEAQTRGTELPFVIIRKSTGKAVGSTRFYAIDRDHRRCEIGYTWLSASAQRTEVNTSCKLLLLTHAFEIWKCIRVGFLTDMLNTQSRNALLRIGSKFEGALRSHMIMPSGRYRDSACFSIIDSEWAVVKSNLEKMLVR